MAPGPILGTMYLPSFSAEINPLQLFKRRINLLCRAAEDARPQRGMDSLNDLCISTQSATDLSAVPDESIDYVFTDPPFGQNIMYSELNFLWECGLGSGTAGGRRTDKTLEAVVSKSQGKGVGEYGELMAAAFAEINRVLKKDRWMTLVFHNTRADVWAAIQRGINAAGLRVEGVQTLDKSHQTFKQVTAEGAVGYDVVVNCRKLPRPIRPKSAQAKPLQILSDLLAGAPQGPCKQRTARHLHARLTGELIKSGNNITMDYKDVLQLLHHNFEALGLKSRPEASGEYWYALRTD